METAIGNLTKKIDESHKYIINGKIKYGKSYSRLYKTWQGMKERCYNVNNSNYDNYGGRGIKVYDKWRDSFLTFEKWSLENGYTDELTLDRIDVNGNYEPCNCRWATLEVQANNRRTNIFVEYNGVTKTIAQWGKEYNILPETIRDRLKRGMSIECALNNPTKYCKKGVVSSKHHIKCEAISPTGEVYIANSIRDLAEQIGFSENSIKNIFKKTNEGFYKYSHKATRNIELSKKFDGWFFKKIKEE